jgi:hypothetical protein
MSTPVALGVAAVLLVALVALQWFIAAAVHRRALTAQRARHAEHQQASIRILEQNKRQIGQLQEELARARFEIQRRRERSVQPAPRASTAAAKEILNQQLDEASALRPAMPVNGFADTLPVPLFAAGVGLMMR